MNRARTVACRRDSHLAFIVTLDGTVNLTTVPDHAQRPASFTALAGGLTARPALISHDGYQHGVHLHLTSLGARVLLGLPAGELANTVVELRILLGPVAGEFVEQLRSASIWTDRFRQLEGVLTRIARARDGPAPELGWAWRRLTTSHGRIRVATLAEEVSRSRRGVARLATRAGAGEMRGRARQPLGQQRSPSQEGRAKLRAGELEIRCHDNPPISGTTERVSRSEPSPL